MTPFVMALFQQPDSPGEAINQAIANAMAGSGGPLSPSGPFRWPGVLVAILPPLAFFAVVALIGWLVFRRSQTRMQARTEFHRQLLDKFTSGGEFATFLNSSGGQRLLEDLWSQRVNAKERIIRSAQGGVVLTVLGLGALVVSHAMRVPGVLVLALGLGFLMSTAISYRLSKQLGLLQDRSHSEGVSRP